MKTILAIIALSLTTHVVPTQPKPKPCYPVPGGCTTCGPNDPSCADGF